MNRIVKSVRQIFDGMSVHRGKHRREGNAGMDTNEGSIGIITSRIVKFIITTRIPICN